MKPILLWAAALCMTLTACGGQPQDMSVAPGSAPASEKSEVLDLEQQKQKTVGSARRAYAAALEDMLKNNVFPDGTALPESETGDLSGNQFAVADVDGDGQEELYVMYVDTITAGMCGTVFAYDETTGTLRTELTEFPLITFYDNGIAEAGWSHNQGRAGEALWPYNLYQYHTQSDDYSIVAMVDAWDQKLQAEGFPAAVDQSGTGVVYYIMENGAYDGSTPVDASVYQAWRKQYMENAREVKLEVQNLTEEAIQKLTS